MSIVVEGLTKTYGPKRVVDDLTFEVLPGRVTGFLGPNGAGKSTTMRCMVDLDRPDSGRVTVDGSPYADLQYPARVVGTLLEARAVNPARKARDHLRMLAACSRVPDSRVEEVMEMTGITSAADRRVGGFSLGMHQRLGLASAILGDPTYMMLDEPTNGLDPEGIRWVREFLRALADQGRAVLVSSHLLAELALFVDHLVVIGKGRLIASTTVEGLTESRPHEVFVKSPRLGELEAELVQRGVEVNHEDGELRLRGTSAAAVGDLAALMAIPLHGLREDAGTLEQAFLDLTAEAQEYRTTHTPGVPPPSGPPGAAVPDAAATGGEVTS
jgi:ABC-2 type transport system ATP-binding protein